MVSDEDLNHSSKSIRTWKNSKFSNPRLSSRVECSISRLVCPIAHFARNGGFFSQPAEIFIRRRSQPFRSFRFFRRSQSDRPRSAIPRTTVSCIDIVSNANSEKRQPMPRSCRFGCRSNSFTMESVNDPERSVDRAVARRRGVYMQILSVFFFSAYLK